MTNRVKAKDFSTSIRLDPNMVHPKFYIESINPQLTTIQRNGRNETYLALSIKFTRRLSGQLVTCYIPSSIVVFISWFNFWLDVDAVPGRVSMGLLCTLAIVTLMLNAHRNLAEICYLMAIDIWLLICVTFVFLSLAEFTLAYVMERFKYNRKVLRHRKVHSKPLEPHSGSHLNNFPRGPQPSLAKLKAWLKNNATEDEQEADNHLIKIAMLIQLMHSLTSYPQASRRSSLNGATLEVTSTPSPIDIPVCHEEKPPRKSNVLDLVSRILFPASFITAAILYFTVIVPIL